ARLQGLAVLRQHLIGFLADELHQLVFVGAPHGIGRPALPLGAASVAVRVRGAPPVEVRSAVAPGTAVIFRDRGAQHFLAIWAGLPVLQAAQRYLPAHLWLGLHDGL